MPTFEVKTVRSFNTQSKFDNWFTRHTLVMKRSGFTDGEIEQMYTPEGLTITDPESGVDGTVTITNIKGIG